MKKKLKAEFTNGKAVKNVMKQQMFSQQIAEL